MTVTFLYELKFPNGKRYIGVSNNVPRRWREHRRNANHSDRAYRVHDAIRRYGHQNVHVTTLVAGEASYIRDLEIAAIAAFKSADKRFGYNLSLGGDVASDETRAALSASQKRRWANTSPEEIARLGAKISARGRSVETCKKLSDALKGKVKTADHLARIAAANKGRRASPESIEKRRAYWTQERRIAQALKRLGKKASQATREKHKAANLGRKHSPETRAKISRNVRNALYNIAFA